jgi:hypothetical protein
MSGVVGIKGGRSVLAISDHLTFFSQLCAFSSAAVHGPAYEQPRVCTARTQAIRTTLPAPKPHGWVPLEAASDKRAALSTDFYIVAEGQPRA